jgi:hypothetical protein
MTQPLRDAPSRVQTHRSTQTYTPPPMPSYTPPPMPSYNSTATSIQYQRQEYKRVQQTLGHSSIY